MINVYVLRLIKMPLMVILCNFTLLRYLNDWLLSVQLFSGCLQNEYQCKNKCIELVKRCDRIADCDEGEDEINCSEHIFFYKYW